MSGVKRTEFTSEMCVNFDLKMDFIQSLVTPEDYENDSLPVRLYKHRMISRVGKVEVFLQKDFCFFTIGEVRMLFERNNWANYDSFSSVKVLLSKYVMYCKSRGLISPESVHPIENIVFEDISHDISSYQYDFKNLMNSMITWKKFIQHTIQTQLMIVDICAARLYFTCSIWDFNIKKSS